MFWGRLSHGCNYCHARPPALPSSEVASRIVAVAQRPIGAGLRAAMQRKELRGTMEHVLAGPSARDAALEALRRYLVDVRVGGMSSRLMQGSLRHRFAVASSPPCTALCRSLTTCNGALQGLQMAPHEFRVGPSG